MPSLTGRIPGQVVWSVGMGALKGALATFGIRLNIKTPGTRKRSPAKGRLGLDMRGLPGKLKGRRP